MTHRDVDDEKLILFLRANKPVVPDASANLEDRIMRATVLRPSFSGRIFAQLRSTRLTVGIPATLGACAAVVVLVLVGRSQLTETLVVSTPTPMASVMTSAEVDDLAQFMETAWHVSVSRDQTSYLIEDLSL